MKEPSQTIMACSALSTLLKIKKEFHIYAPRKYISTACNGMIEHSLPGKDLQNCAN